MTNESAILGLLAELYSDRAALLAENATLRRQVEALQAETVKDAGGIGCVRDD